MTIYDEQQQKRTEFLVKTIQKTLEELEQPQQQQPQQQQQQQQQQAAEQQVPPMVQQMDVDADIAAAAPAQAPQVNQQSRKKRESLESARQKAADQRVAVRQMEHNLLAQRIEMSQQTTMTPEQIRAEAALLEEKLKASRLAEQAQLLEFGNNSQETKRIRWEAQAERARAVGDYARSLPLGSKERAQAMAAKEKQELKADHLRREYKISQIENTAERKREEATLSRHDKYDALKSIFRKENPLAHEDAQWTHPDTGHLLVNVGRAFFGGTKPMYIFEDRSSPIVVDGRITGYKQYLFKEAVNCIGRYKPEGALVTEAASRLQEKICGEDSIPAFAAIQDGRVLGSFQEKVESIHGEGAVDLFSWQTAPQDNLSDQVKREILREHALDWLLCNFDTKGENFLTKQSNGHLCSFDKEASFGRLKDAGAAHMSHDYKPHANDTLYNTVFTEFIKGTLDLDLSAVLTQIETVEAMPREEYMGLFDAMLTQKYGPAGPQNTARAQAESAMWARKAGLREEYRRFYTALIHSRQEKMNDPNQHADSLDEKGNFRFAGESKIRLLDKGIQNTEDVLVHNIPRETLTNEGATTYNLTLPEGEAQRMKEASNGFLTYRKNQDGSCTMRPSMPEKVVFDGEEVEFRKNYKRLTSLFAGLAVSANGQLNMNGPNTLNELTVLFAVDLGMGNLNKGGESRLRAIMLPIFRQEAHLCGDQTPEQAMDEMVRFLRLAQGYNAKGEKTPSYKISAFNAEWIISLSEMLPLNQTLQKTPEEIRALIQQAQKSDPSITDEMVEQMLTVDLPAFRLDYERAVDTTARCAGQDMDSEEVFLLGACSATAQLVSCVTNPGEAGVEFKKSDDTPLHALNHHSTDLADEIPEELEARMTLITGKPFHLSDDPKQRLDQFRTINDFCSYKYHTAGNVGQIDGMSISLEAFAAEAYQLIAPGLTDQAGIGLFQDQEAFRKFYAKNADAVLSPDQLRRFKFKDILRNASQKA